LYVVPLQPQSISNLTVDDWQVPPEDLFDSVPLGSSSASMYPGYSPADHIYGEASQEYGSEFAKATKEGKEPKFQQDGLEYVVGHARVNKRKQLEEIHERRKSQDSGQEGNASVKTQNKAEGAKTRTKTAKDKDEVMTEPSGESNPYFVIDSTPAPISIPGRSSHKSKKVKTTHETSDTGATTAAPIPVIETEDISAEVAERMKAKKEKGEKKDKKDKEKDKKDKMEKKRKRESGDSTILPEPASADQPAETAAETTRIEKPKKKKVKKVEVVDETVVDASAAAYAGAEEKEKSKKDKKDKKEKKRAAADVVEEGATKGEVDGEVDGGKKKKGKKSA
jgi:hypothetical protein